MKHLGWKGKRRDKVFEIQILLQSHFQTNKHKNKQTNKQTNSASHKITTKAKSFAVWNKLIHSEQFQS